MASYGIPEIHPTTALVVRVSATAQLQYDYEFATSFTTHTKIAQLIMTYLYSCAYNRISTNRISNLNSNHEHIIIISITRWQRHTQI